MRLHSEIHAVSIDESTIVMDEVLAYIKGLDAGDRVILRWGLVRLEKRRVLVEVAILTDCEAYGSGNSHAPIQGIGRSGFHIALVVPTGVGAAVGGFIGDAS